MDYMVRSREDGLEIDIPEPGTHRAALIETIEACREGTCDCPSEEVRKVSSVRVEDGPLYMSMTLTPRDGEPLDIVEVERAVHWAVRQIES